jgi:hypothetical protein
VMKVLKIKYRGRTRGSTSNGTNKKKPPRKRVKDNR